MIWIRDLLPDNARKAQITALERAAHQLANSDRIDLVRFSFGRPRVLATKVGLRVRERPPPARRRPLTVDEIPRLEIGI